MCPSSSSDSTSSSTVSRRSGLGLRGELVQVGHVRCHRAVPAADLRIRRLDHEVLVRRVRPTAVSETVVTGHGSGAQDRKSTRLNSSHLVISYAVFCLKKKKKDM